MDMGTLLHSSIGRQKTLVTIYGEPPRATAQQKGVDTRCGYPRFYKKARQREEEKKTVLLLKLHKPKDYVIPEGPLIFGLKMVWPYRKSEKKALTRTGLEIPMDVRPDNSNLVKMVEDAMTLAGYWKDDAQVTFSQIKKRWGPKAYWQISIERDWLEMPTA